MLLLVLGIVLFIGLVILHEMGHFFVARRNGVKVEEFGIFFPPRLYKKKTKEGWDFTINLLPLGGFVKLKGEHDADKEEGTFGAASDKAKVKIMLAGVAVNLLTAVVMFLVLALVGMPRVIENQFTVASDTKIVSQKVFAGFVEPGSPADKSGLKQRDQLLTIRSIDEQKMYTLGKTPLPEITKSLAGKKVEISYKNSLGEQKTTIAQLLSKEDVRRSDSQGNHKGYLGIQPLEYTVQRSTWSAPIVAAGLTAQLTKQAFWGLGRALSGLGGILAGALSGNQGARSNAQTKASSQVSGPVGIFMILKSGTALGIQFILMIIAVISLTLAIMNVLPIPALDGGRLFVMLVSRTLKKPIKEKTEDMIYTVGFLVLISLIILITIVDVKRFF